MKSQSEKSKATASELEPHSKLRQLSNEELLNQLACSPCAERQLDANTPLEEYLLEIKVVESVVPVRIPTSP